MYIESMMASNHLILCCPLLLSPSMFSSIKIFSKESALHIWWPKSWGFSISPSNEYSELISFRIYWFDLIAVHGTLKSLFQDNSKASMLWQSLALSLLYGPDLTSIHPYTWGAGGICALEGTRHRPPGLPYCSPLSICIWKRERGEWWMLVGSPLSVESSLTSSISFSKAALSLSKGKPSPEEKTG